MDFNTVLFPAPPFEQHEFDSNYLSDGIILIPKCNKRKSSWTQAFCNCGGEYHESSYIPCRFVEYEYEGYYSDKILIYFHANREDIFQSTEFVELLSIQLEINILMVEYPGYSTYNSQISCQKIEKDTLIVYQYLMQKQVLPENIFVLGRSIGSGPACYLASKRKVGLLVVMAGFTSIKAVAKDFVGSFLSILVKQNFNNLELIKKIDCPTFFIHGQQDEIIDCKHGQELYRESVSLKTGFIFPQDMTHNCFYLKDDIVEPLLLFLHKLKIAPKLDTERFYKFFQQTNRLSQRNQQFREQYLSDNQIDIKD